MRASHPTPIALIGAFAALAVLAGCAASAPNAASLPAKVAVAEPDRATAPHASVLPDLEYGSVDGQPLMLDACLPPDANPASDPPRAAIVIVHGGSWARGDKADAAWRSVCTWLAAAGYVSFNVDYRLAPMHPFPAAIDDVENAVRWIRDPAQVARFGIDPARIGAFGGSAGANLAALLGTRGHGPVDSGARVAAVTELSGPVDLTGVAVTSAFLPVQLSYLGCRNSGCPAAAKASATHWIDPSDPPFFIAYSTRERIPLAQGERLDRDLRAAGISTEFVKVPGTLHSIAMLTPALEKRIVAFYDRTLAPSA